MFFATLLLCCEPSLLIAQDRRDDSLVHIYARQEDDSLSAAYFVVRFNRPVNVSQVNISRNLDDSTAIVSLTELLAIPNKTIVWKKPARNEWKLSSQLLLNKIDDGYQPTVVASKDLDELQLLLKKEFPSVIILDIDRTSGSVVVRVTKKDILRLLAEPLVVFISARPDARSEIGIIGYNRSFHGINALSYYFPEANGKDIVVGVKEQRMDAEDLDLHKRVLPSSIAAEQVSYHATVISSIIGGAGNSFYDGLGIANGCRFFPSSYERLFADEASVLSNAGVAVQNHSYGTIIQSFYGAEALSYDAQSYETDMLHIFSAGNQGTGAASEGVYAGIQGYANLTGNFKMAKNVVSVGAVDNKNQIQEISSAGPTYDGRLAPQMMALGPNGTSDAAAMVTGTAAVLQQVFADNNDQRKAPSSLIKAILYSSTDDINKPGIDYKTGYGLLNSFRALILLKQRTYFSGSLNTGSEWSETISVPANAAQLKLTLCWNDPAATLNNDRALTNDLDLELISLSDGQSFQPWVLSRFPHRDSLEKPALRARDSSNTSEQITVNLPAPGQYQIKVKASKLISPESAFSVAYWIDTLNTFQFTSPLHTTDINLKEDEGITIKWTAKFADEFQKGSLSVSYDEGNSWEPIASEIDLASGVYQWESPQSSGNARLKMQTGAGEFLSGVFSIADVIELKPDFVCNDSMRLSWNRQANASSYDLYALGDSPYLQKTLSTSDTFFVLDRKQYRSLVYAVQPRFANNLPAARSIAVNITLQGVDCFYKALNYVLEDGNKLRMILELSAASYTDSVYFEQVTENGMLLKTFDRQKALPDQNVYVTATGHPSFGTIHIRAGIRLKNGSILYTHTIPVFSSGAKNVLFYPNPVPKGETLKYVMKQGISPDCRLQIYNVHGQMIKAYASLPRTVELSFLTRGIYLFKLTDQNGGVVATEKIVIP